MTDLPSGPVTLLFTDIEGSTQLLRQLADGYAQVLADHHRILRKAFAAHDGHEVDNQGDSFFVAFAGPLDAVLAAAEARQALYSYPWPEGNVVRVRMGLHSGQPLLTEDRYLGLDVHRAARIEAAAHGGQVLQLVGRESELVLLRERLSAARTGRGSLVLLAGEPGIGKTRLLEEVAGEAQPQGVTVLWGRCWEGEGAPAFWPWLQVLRSSIERQSPLTLRVELGSGAAEVAQLLPEVGERLPDLVGAGLRQPAMEPETARFRLFDAISRFLSSAAQARPLLLLLEDLHWADTSSLLLVQFLTQRLASLPILVLGSYRDTDLDRSYPLAEVLPSLRRAQHVERILVRGLSREEVERLLTVREGQALDAAGQRLAEAVQRETEGNPFFIGEVLRHLAESGKLWQHNGRWIMAVTSIAELGIPEGVREVIGRRLSRLSEETNRLLTIAAVQGREFEAGLLERVVAAGADEVDTALAEAETARVIDLLGKGGRYRFAHALVRETLYGELPSRRQEWLRLAEEFSEFPLQAVPARTASLLLLRVGDLALADGDRAGAEATYQRLRDLAERSRYPLGRPAGNPSRDSARHAGWTTGGGTDGGGADGRPSNGVRLRLWGLQFAVFYKVRPLSFLGRGAEFAEALDDVQRALGEDSPVNLAYQGLAYAYTGQREEALGTLRQFLSAAGRGRSIESATTIEAAILLETVLPLGAREEVARLAGYLEPRADAYLDVLHLCAGRLLGEAPVLLGDQLRARGYFERGLALAERIQARPEIALLHLDLAELAVAARS